MTSFRFQNLFNLWQSLYGVPFGSDADTALSFFIIATPSLFLVEHHQKVGLAHKSLLTEEMIVYFRELFSNLFLLAFSSPDPLLLSNLDESD